MVLIWLMKWLSHNGDDKDEGCPCSVQLSQNTLNSTYFNFADAWLLESSLLWYKFLFAPALVSVALFFFLSVVNFLRFFIIFIYCGFLLSTKHEIKFCVLFSSVFPYLFQILYQVGTQYILKEWINEQMVH